MASYTFFRCNAGAGVQAGTVGGGGVKDVPNCNAGQGSWVTVEIYDPTAATPQSIAQQLELIGVNASSVTAAFAWGFGAYCLFWALGYVAKKAVEAINAA